MKTTGIVRRVDDLGRIVIPKEIRRNFRIKEGEPLEIFSGEINGYPAIGLVKYENSILDECQKFINLIERECYDNDKEYILESLYHIAEKLKEDEC